MRNILLNSLTVLSAIIMLCLTTFIIFAIARINSAGHGAVAGLSLILPLAVAAAKTVFFNHHTG